MERMIPTIRNRSTTAVMHLRDWGRNINDSDGFLEFKAMVAYILLLLLFAACAYAVLLSIDSTGEADRAVQFLKGLLPSWIFAWIFE